MVRGATRMGRAREGGTPDQLTATMIQEIYGDDTETAVDETLTSTIAATSPSGRQMETAH